MNYLEALNYLYTDRNFSKIRPGLKRVKELLKYFGNPHESCYIAHITGTNGKGSTSNFLYNLLRKIPNLKIGLYTSPHLTTFRERIVFDGRRIDKDYVRDFVKNVLPIVKKLDEKGPEYMSTFFELTTVMAFKYFKDMKADFVVLEVGLGGRFDATNVIENPVVSIITSVDLDHTKILGNNIERIAYEKAGIIKRGSKVVIGETKSNALKIIEEEAMEKGSEIYIYNRDFKYDNPVLTLSNNHFDYTGIKRKLTDLRLTMNGEHQFLNCSVALAAFELIEKDLNLTISEKEIREALESTNWPGRFEVMEFKGKKIILDGAHNPSGFEKLRESLNRYFPNKPKVAIVGILDDKDYKKMIETVKDTFAEIILTKPLSNRTSNIKEIFKYLSSIKKQVTYIESPINALKNAIDNLDYSKILIVTGSLYLVGYLRNYLEKLIQGV